MICAGTSIDPMNCEDKAITIISGFAMCKRHADEMVYAFKMTKSQMRMKKMYGNKKYIDPDLKSGSGLNLTEESIGGVDGRWRNVKNTR